MDGGVPSPDHGASRGRKLSAPVDQGSGGPTLIDGKYQVLSKIREGGMGAIYLVRHVLLDEVRVVKAMRGSMVDDEDAKRRFAREARMATGLRHPNIAA